MAGGRVFDESIKALAPFGRLVAYGIASREQNELRTGGLMRRSHAVVGFWLIHCLAARRWSTAPLADLFERAPRGDLRVVEGETYGLSEVRRAHEDLAARRTSGKLVLDPLSDASPEAVWAVLVDGAALPRVGLGRAGERRRDDRQGREDQGRLRGQSRAARSRWTRPEPAPDQRMTGAAACRLACSAACARSGLTPRRATAGRASTMREEYNGAAAAADLAHDARPRPVVRAVRRRPQGPRRAGRRSARLSSSAQ